jgi:hypothetical protein
MNNLLQFKYKKKFIEEFFYISGTNLIISTFKDYLIRMIPLKVDAFVTSLYYTISSTNEKLIIVGQKIHPPFCDEKKSKIAPRVEIFNLDNKIMEEKRILEHRPFVHAECYIVDAVIPQNSDICLTLVKNVELNDPETKIFVWEYITLGLKCIYLAEFDIESIICNPNNTYQFIFLNFFHIGIFEYSHSKKKILAKKVLEFDNKEIADATYLKNDSFFSFSNNIQGIIVSFRDSTLYIYDEELELKRSFDLKIMYKELIKKFDNEPAENEELEEKNKILATQKKKMFRFKDNIANLYIISRGNLLFNFMSSTSFYFILEINFDNFDIKIFSIESLKRNLTEKSSVLISLEGKKIYSIIGVDNGKNMISTIPQAAKIAIKKPYKAKKLVNPLKKNKKEGGDYKGNKEEIPKFTLEKKKIFYSCYNLDISYNLLEDTDYILENKKNLYLTPKGIFTNFDFDYLTNSAFGLDINKLIISDNPRLVVSTYFNSNYILFSQQFNLNDSDQKFEDFEGEGNFSKAFSESNDLTQSNFNLNLIYKYLMQAELEYEPLTISMNSYGNCFFVTYEESAYIYAILDNCIKEACKISSSCKTGAFSNTGLYFAFSTMEFTKEDYQIVIVNSRTFEVEYLITNLSGYATKIIWMDSDRIITALIDEKDVYGWKLNERRIIARNKEKVESKKNALGDVVNPNANIILRLVECGEKIVDYCYDYAIDYLMILTDEFRVRIFRPNKDDESWEFDLDCKYLSLLLIRKLDICIFGTSEGSIRICIWPISNFTKKASLDHPHFTEKFIHAGPVIQLVASNDNKFLYSCGADGSIYVSNLITYCNDAEIKMNTFMYFNPKNILSKKVYMKYSDFTNLTEGMYKEKCDVIKKRQTNITSINQEFASEMDKINGENSKASEDKRFSTNNEIEKERKIVKELEDNKELLSKNLKEKRENQIKTFKEEINKMKKIYKTEKSQLQVTSKNLSNLIKDVKSNYAYCLDVISQKGKSTFDKLKQMLDNVLKNLNTKLSTIMKLIESRKEDFEKRIFELENEKEGIIKDEETNKKRQKEINQIKISELTAEIDRISKDNLNYSERIREWEKNLKELRENNGELMESFLFNSLKLKQMNKYLSDNELKISDRESVVKEKRLVNDRLEKLRFVLEYQIKNLIKERQPIEEQIKNFDDLHNDFYRRFNLLYAEQLNMDEFIGNNLNLIENFKEELSQRKQNLYYLKNVFRALDLEIHFIFRTKIEDKNVILNRLIDIYDKYLKEYVEEDNMTSFAIETFKNGQAMEKEIKRQKNKVLKELNNKRKEVSTIQNEKEKIMHKIQWENTQLIEECSSVRLNLEDILKYINDIEKKFIELTKTHMNLSKQPNVENIKSSIKKAKDKILEADINKVKAMKDAEKLSRKFFFFI